MSLTEFSLLRSTTNIPFLGTENGTWLQTSSDLRSESSKTLIACWVERNLLLEEYIGSCTLPWRRRCGSSLISHFTLKKNDLAIAKSYTMFCPAMQAWQHQLSFHVPRQFQQWEDSSIVNGLSTKGASLLRLASLWRWREGVQALTLRKKYSVLVLLYYNDGGWEERLSVHN